MLTHTDKINLFWLLAWGLLLVVAVLGIWWAAFRFVAAGICLLWTVVYLKEYIVWRGK